MKAMTIGTPTTSSRSTMRRKRREGRATKRG